MKSFVFLVAALGAIAVSGCGKKGPPLAPLIRVPAAVETLQARRLGSEVYISLTIPAANVDGSIPASVSAIEVYGYTGRMPPPRGAWAGVGTLVARVDVPLSPLPVTSGPRSATKKTAAPAPIALEPGGSITVVDTLTEDEFVQGPVAAPDPRERRRVAATDVAVPTEQLLPLRRFYVAYAFSPRGTPGPTGTAAEFVLRPLPPAPPDFEARYTPTGVSLTWEPSGGLIGFLLDRTLPDEPPIEDLDAPDEPPPAANTPPVVANISGPTRYLVYRVFEPDPLGPLPATPEVDQSWNTQLPVQENAAPLSELSFVDRPVMFGRGRCYSVRAVRGLKEPDLLVGEPSPPVCFTPVDVFPPAAPLRLAAVASEGAISLIWEPNTELDLGGYLVLRGDASDATLQPLTATPIVDARYRDTSAKPDTRYVYAVIAVDNRLPVPNWSAESNRVEETAR